MSHEFQCPRGLWIAYSQDRDEWHRLGKLFVTRDWSMLACFYHRRAYAILQYKSIDVSFRRVHNCFILGLDMQTLPATRHQVGGLGGLSHSLLAIPRSNRAGRLIDEACEGPPSQQAVVSQFGNSDSDSDARANI